MITKNTAIHRFLAIKAREDTKRLEKEKEQNEILQRLENLLEGLEFLKERGAHWTGEGYQVNFNPYIENGVLHIPYTVNQELALKLRRERGRNYYCLEDRFVNASYCFPQDKYVQYLKEAALFDVLLETLVKTGLDVPPNPK